MLYAGRFIGGFAGGICSVVSPTYLSTIKEIKIRLPSLYFKKLKFFTSQIGEITMPTLRGILGMFFSTFVCSGILVTSLMGWLNWRLISAISAIFPVILFAAMFFAPESPYYLIKAGTLFYFVNLNT
jgi:MFS family permease